jgi:hypothetical protein
MSKIRSMAPHEIASIYNTLDKVLIRREDETCQYMEGYSDRSVTEGLEKTIPGVNVGHVINVRLRSFGKLYCPAGRVYTSRDQMQVDLNRIDDSVREAFGMIAQYARLLAKDEEIIAQQASEIADLKARVEKVEGILTGFNQLKDLFGGN